MSQLLERRERQRERRLPLDRRERISKQLVPTPKNTLYSWLPWWKPRWARSMQLATSRHTFASTLGSDQKLKKLSLTAAGISAQLL
jgi:hypothetical protein